MICPIITDPMLLSQKSVPAQQTDLPVVIDLLDTLKAHQEHCLGMAANMIGVQKRIIAIQIGGICMPLINPTITHTGGKLYETEEGCLSHQGSRMTKRFPTITVSYLDQNWKMQKQTFSDLAAQVIQHEIDHCNGILI